MMENEKWFTLQSEDELMSEARAKELRVKRCRVRHAFKDEINRRTQEGECLSMRGKFEIFRSYYQALELSDAEKERIVFSQELQKAMNVRSKDEKPNEARDIYTDIATGKVGSICLSKDITFIKNCKDRFTHRAERAQEKADICSNSLKRIQRDAPKQYELWEQGNGTEK